MRLYDGHMARLGDYWAKDLPESHREALDQSLGLVVDDFLGREEHEKSLLASYLPPRYTLRYNEFFYRKFFAVMMTVGYKLAQPDPPVPTLSCVAEELACHALISDASAALEEQGVEPQFGSFEDDIFQDEDYEYLFSGSMDGVEDSEVGAALGIGNLRFDEWFEPFLNAKTPVHPYAT